MTIQSIASVPVPATRVPAPPTAARDAGGSQGGDSAFATLIRNLVDDTNSQHSLADDAVRELMTGQTDNLHDVVLQAAKADLSFRLLMEIRNRLIDSYQEIMRMQV